MQVNANPLVDRRWSNCWRRKPAENNYAGCAPDRVLLWCTAAFPTGTR
jgi:hypothetical protein